MNNFKRTAPGKKPKPGPWKKSSGGFTVIEAMVSLLLAILAAAFIGSTILYSMDSGRRSKFRFNMGSCLEFHKNRLIARGFQAPEMLPGEYEETENGYNLKWTVTPISPTLKLIRLTVRRRYRGRLLSKKTYLYKSLHTRNVARNVKPN